MWRQSHCLYEPRKYVEGKALVTVTLYIYRETIYLSLIGILVGFGVGFGLHQYMVDVIPPENIMFNPSLGWLIYAVPTLVVIVILTGLGIFVNQHLKKVNMLEALKSVE